MRRKVDRGEVASEIPTGVSVELLKELHLLTRDGDLNADSRRKLKQVAHLLRLVAPAVSDVMQRFGEPVLVDCGAGKSALGFLLHDVYLRGAGKGVLWNVEERADLVRAAEERAARLGATRMRFCGGAIAQAPVPERVHLVTALHACDTATDEALALAVRHNADHVALVPCCQAEVARQLGEASPPDPAMAALCAHPWHRRELGSHLTNVVRVLVLEAAGYKVIVTELAGWEHALKNELILARRIRKEDRDARARLDGLLAALGPRVRPAALRALEA